MAGRAAIMLALGIPVAAGLLYLVLGSAPLAYPLANALALLIAVPIAAFAPLRLAEREQRVLTLVLLALLFVPLVSGPHLGTVARWLPLGPVNLHTGALALPALVVLAARDEDYAPPILLAALLAAIMSTISSQLLVASSSLTEDFYKLFFRRHASERESVNVGRICVALVAIAAIIIASDPDSQVLGLVSNAWAGFGAAFGPLIILSLTWDRMTGAGAVAGLVTGAAVVIAWIALGWNAALPGMDQGLYEIVPGFIAAWLAIFLVSKATAGSSDRPLPA